MTDVERQKILIDSTTCGSVKKLNCRCYCLLLLREGCRGAGTLRSFSNVTICFHEAIVLSAELVGTNKASVVFCGLLVWFHLSIFGEGGKVCYFRDGSLVSCCLRPCLCCLFWGSLLNSIMGDKA